MNSSTPMDEHSANRDAALPGEHVLHRIAWLTLGLGFAAAVVAAVLHHKDWAKGIACGTVLGWLNFRWLKRGVLAMVTAASTQNESNPAPAVVESGENQTKPASSPVATYLAALFRYALIGLGVYVIFNYLHVPLVSIGFGLCALGAATIAASVWEALKPAS